MASALSSIKSISIRRTNIEGVKEKVSLNSKSPMNSNKSDCRTNYESHYSSRTKREHKPSDHLPNQIPTTPRVFKPNGKSQLYMKSMIDRLFKKCQEEMCLGEVMTLNSVIEVFVLFGFFGDPLSERDKGSFSVINRLLNRGNKGINKRNLIKLVYVICNVSERGEDDDQCYGLKRDTNSDNHFESWEGESQIGVFDQNNNWVLTQQDRIKIKSKLGHLYYNRISNENIKYSKPLKQPQFQTPRLSINSSRLSLKHRKHLESIGNSQDVSGIYQREEVYKQKHKEWVERKREDGREKELGECSFRPSLNKSNNSKYSSVISLDKENECQVKRYNKRVTSVEKRQVENLKECSFKPQLSRYKEINTSILNVKNSQKSITRIQQAYKKKLQISTSKERGYPKSLYKYSPQPKPKPNHNMHNTILQIDIKIKNKTSTLKIYEGQLFQNLVCRILVMNQLPYQYISKVEELLQEILKNCDKVSVKDGFVVLK